MAGNQRTKRPMNARQTHLKVAKHRKMLTRFRGRRAKTKEIISRVYSERREAKAISPMVAFKPYATEQLPSRESTAIYSMEYDPKSKLLWITFWGYKQRHKGSTYIFYGVPEQVWTAINEASSKGRYFYYFIRTKYKYTKL